MAIHLGKLLEFTLWESGIPKRRTAIRVELARTQRTADQRVVGSIVADLDGLYKPTQVHHGNLSNWFMGYVDAPPDKRVRKECDSRLAESTSKLYSLARVHETCCFSRVPPITKLSLLGLSVKQRI